MANVNVTYEEMERVAFRLGQGQEQLIQELQDLRGQVDELVANGFVTDSASGAFQETYTQFTTGATQTVSALEGMQKYLNSAASTMQQTDSQLASSIKSS